MKSEIIFCEHANEVPVCCPCNSDCYCKDNTCKPKVKQIEPTDDDGESIACPYCDETWADLWDYDWESNRECIEIECPYCEKHITLCANHTVDYTCYPEWKSESK